MFPSPSPQYFTTNSPSFLHSLMAKYNAEAQVQLRQQKILSELFTSLTPGSMGMQMHFCHLLEFRGDN